MYNTFLKTFTALAFLGVILAFSPPALASDLSSPPVSAVGEGETPTCEANCCTEAGGVFDSGCWWPDGNGPIGGSDRDRKQDQCNDDCPFD